MVDLGKSRALVRTGATVMLTLSMTVGSVPLNGFAAYAQEVSASQEAAAAVEKTPDGFYLEKGRAYEVPVALKKDDGSESMAAEYFEKNGTVTWDGSKYTVTFTITKEGQGYVTAITNAQSLGNGSYSVTADSLKESIKLDFKLTIPGLGAMDRSGYLHVDTAGLDT